MFLEIPMHGIRSNSFDDTRSNQKSPIPGAYSSESFCRMQGINTRNLVYSVCLMLAALLGPHLSICQDLKFAGLRVAIDAGEQTSVLIEAPGAGEAKTLALVSPPRMVFDIKGKFVKRPEFVANLDERLPFARIRLAIRDDVTRLVFDLKATGISNPLVTKSTDRLQLVWGHEVTQEKVLQSSNAQVPARAINTVSAALLPAAPVVSQLSRVSSPKREVLLVSAQVLRDQAKLKFSVDRLYVEFLNGERPVQKLTVKNTSDRVLFVSVAVQQLLQPGSANEGPKTTKDLLVTPRHFEIHPGVEKNLRLVLVGSRDRQREEIFRISLVPQIDSFDNQVELHFGSESQTLNLVTGLDVHVTVSPNNPSPKLKWEESGGTLRLTNTGNVSIALLNGKMCTNVSLSNESCEDVPNRLLYPEGSVEFKQKIGTTLRFLRRSGSSFEPLEVPARHDLQKSGVLD